MELWMVWWMMVQQLRPAFGRTRAFLWFAVALAATCARADLAGVTSFIRTLGLKEYCYDRLLDFYHSKSTRLEFLTHLWTRALIKTLKPFLYTINDRIVLLADGIKVGKTGRKMPSVKKLFQSSDNNTKPDYIFGHSCQTISLLVKAASSFVAIPLASRIHEGVVFSNRDQRSLLDKLILLLGSLGLTLPYYLIADCYYASRSIILPLLKKGRHLITSARTNAVAYEPVLPPDQPKRGRHKTYGRKVLLAKLFQEADTFISAASPIYAEKHVTLKYRVVDLVWRPIGILVRFVLVIHPTRGIKILLSTDCSLNALQIIAAFGLRFKIEVSFKQAIYTVGVYAYHFWMKGMTPRSSSSGNQYLHRKDSSYREQVRRKIRAYHLHIQIGCIAQGMLQCLSIVCPSRVWKYFGSWLRTVRPGIPPSEFVVSIALRHSLPLFLADSPIDHPLVKFIREHMDLTRCEIHSMVA